MREQVRNVERAILAALARGETLDPDALLFLLRVAQVCDDDVVTDRLGRALAEALPHAARASTASVRAAWVALLVELRPLSDDDRIDPTLAELLVALRSQWTAPAICDAAPALEATLRAATLSAYSAAAADAVDELERLIGAHYRPGLPIGAFPDQVRAASALFTAYGVSGRLAYSMLAEELMQSARQTAPDDFDTVTGACEAARVFCRLALLHADPQYRAAAVVAPDVNYREDAARLLTAIAADADGRGAGIYGLALLELESASSLP